MEENLYETSFGCTDHSLSDDDDNVLYEEDSEIDDYQIYEIENQSNNFNYVEEATNVLNTHQTITIENTLKLNKTLQFMLMKFKYKLEYLLQQCKKKYDDNEKMMIAYDKQKCSNRKDLNKITKRNTTETRVLRSYNLCGAPYFKDKSLFPAPYNSDYNQRKLLGELFPFDLNYVQHSWTLRDKINVVQGVRNQLITYLKMKISKKRYNNKNQINSNKQNNNHKNDINEIDIKTNNLNKLYNYVINDDNFKIDWYRISTENLNGRHPENACITMWNMYLKPNLNRDKWTNVENEKLLKIATKYNYENWHMISLEMNNRSEFQCFVHFRTEIALKLSNGKKWTKFEDDLLIKVVEKYRVGKLIRWNMVVTHFPHRTKKQLYARYANSLNPSINRDRFTKEEDCVLMAAIQQYGQKFSNIPITLFPGRTRIQIRNRYNNVLRYVQLQKCWTIDDDKELMNLVEKYGTSNWYKISNELKHHSRISCRTRYTVIKRYLEKYPNTKIDNIPRKGKRPLTDIHLDNWIDKIIEIREKDTAKSDNKVKLVKKETYKDKLRPIEKKFYEYFKLSYNYKFNNNNRICVTKDWKNLTLLTTLFGLNLNTCHNLIDNGNRKKFHLNEFKTIKSFLNKLNTIQNHVCVIESDFSLPPNWSILVGLRAIYIKYLSKNSAVINNNINDCNDIDNEMKDKYNDNDDVKCTKLTEIAKKRFRDRFFSVFYKSVLLSKIELKTEESIEDYL